MKLVSILICTYNAEKTIKETLKSCLNQTYNDFEILIHDDQSTDKTLDIINNIGDKRIKIIKSGKKLGPYKGLNFLLEHAKGDYIAIQDHDDLRYPEKLEKQVKFLEENEKYVGCGTKTLMWYEGDNKGFEYYLGKENYYTIHPSLMFRNEGYRYPNRVYMNDAYFQKMVLCKGKNLIYNIDETLTVHRIKKGAENYSYKWFKYSKENIKTIFELHPFGYGCLCIGFETLRKLIYPSLHRIKKDNWIDRIERLFFRLLGYKIIGIDKIIQCGVSLPKYNGLTSLKKSYKAVFLDRDGTLNYDSAYVYKIEDLKTLDGVKEGLKILKNLGYKLIIISNQSGIGRGYFTMGDCKKFNEELQKQLGIKFDGIYICPHTPDEDCKCRKPKTLLIEKAVQDFELDIDQCFFVGDKECDIQTGINTGCRTVLIKNDQYECNIEPDFSFNSVFEFASKLKE